MRFLFAGTAIVWLSIFVYMISLSVRQKKLERRIELLDQRNDNVK